MKYPLSKSEKSAQQIEKETLSVKWKNTPSKIKKPLSKSETSAWYK
jgi:hypothetical protein